MWVGVLAAGRVNDGVSHISTPAEQHSDDLPSISHKSFLFGHVLLSSTASPATITYRAPHSDSTSNIPLYLYLLYLYLLNYYTIVYSCTAWYIEIAPRGRFTPSTNSLFLSSTPGCGGRSFYPRRL